MCAHPSIAIRNLWNPSLVIVVVIIHPSLSCPVVDVVLLVIVVIHRCLSLALSLSSEEVLVDGMSTLTLEHYFADFEENIEWGGEEYNHAMDEGIIRLLHYYYLLLLLFRVMVGFVLFSTKGVETDLAKGTVLYSIKWRCQYLQFLLDTSNWKTDQRLAISALDHRAQ